MVIEIEAGLGSTQARPVKQPLPQHGGVRSVSRVCEAIKDEFDTWKARDLSDVALEYLFLDGSHFRMHDGARAEPVLAAWGITTEGRPVLVGLDSDASESTDAWKGFLDGLVSRGLRAPLLVVSDGAPGLIAAVELVFPNSLRQRCAIHRCRNILAKVPVEHQAEVKAAYWAIFDPTGEPPGEASIVARQRAGDFSVTFGRRFPSAVACLNDDLASLSLTCASPSSTTSGSGTPTSSSAPSARPAEGSRSSAGSPESAPVSAWCGRCSTGPAAAGEASP